MSYFYAAYTIGSSFPGSDRASRAYEIYENELDFLDSLEGYIEYAKSCLCDADEDDEAEMEQWFEDCEYSLENYKDYQRLIEEKRRNPSSDNGLYSKSFYEFDVEIDIELATSDYKLFIEMLHDDLIDRSGWREDLDTEDNKELYSEFPMLKHTASVKLSGNYPSEKNFRQVFLKNQDRINEESNTLDV